MDMLYGLFIAPFADFGFMQRALVGSLMLSLGACPVGVFLMLRRMSLSGDAMAHAILPGAAAGFLLYGLEILPMTIGGLIAGIIVALGAGAVSRFTIQREDASMAAFYLISLAIGVLMVSIRGSSVDLMHVLFGTVLALNNEALTLIGGIVAVTLVSLAIFWRALVAECLDPLFLRSVSRLGQPGAFHLPRPRRAEPRRRLPGARYLAVGRTDDAAGRRRPLLDRARRADVRAGGADRLCFLRRRAALVLSRVAAVRPGHHPVRRRRLFRLDPVRHARHFARAHHPSPPQNGLILTPPLKETRLC